MKTCAQGRLVYAALLAALLVAPGQSLAVGTDNLGAPPITQAQFQALNDRITRLEDRAAVENLFSRYMYLHSAFQDRQIPALWVKKGTRNIAIMASTRPGTASWSITKTGRIRPASWFFIIPPTR